MSKDKSDVRAKVQARTKAEREARKEAKSKKANEINAKKAEISDEDLKGYISENRVGDAKLYCRLFRGLVIYVKY